MSRRFSFSFGELIVPGEMVTGLVGFPDVMHVVELEIDCSSSEPFFLG